MGTIILETERLILRQLEDKDMNDLAEILQDTEVMYTYEHIFSYEDVKDWLQRQKERYQHYGFGLWAVVLKENHEMIGQAGLTIQKYKDQEVLEIGYLLKKKYWHQGYASEAALGCKIYAFDYLKAESVYSIIKADNKASIKVANNIGMKKIDEFITQYYHGDMLHYLYVCDNNIAFSN